MNKINQIGVTEIKYRGINFQITHRLMKTGSEEKVFEEAHRAPGTRCIVLSTDKTKVLLTKEFRHQLGKIDTRLPGGKVFDSLKEHLEFMSSGKDIIQIAEQAARKEVLEETGLIVDEIKFLKKTKCGGMMEWDLYYFVVEQTHSSPTGQLLESGEEIEIAWVDIKNIVKMCLDGEIKEDRSVSILLQYIHSELDLI